MRMDTFPARGDIFWVFHEKFSFLVLRISFVKSVIFCVFLTSKCYSDLFDPTLTLPTQGLEPPTFLIEGFFRLFLVFLAFFFRGQQSAFLAPLVVQLTQTVLVIHTGGYSSHLSAVPVFLTAYFWKI